MLNKTIVIEIDHKGDVSINGDGFVGPECQRFIEEISSCIGGTTSSTKKKEYNNKVVKRQRERN